MTPMPIMLRLRLPEFVGPLDRVQKTRLKRAFKQSDVRHDAMPAYDPREIPHWGQVADLFVAGGHVVVLHARGARHSVHILSECDEQSQVRGFTQLYQLRRLAWSQTTRF